MSVPTRTLHTLAEEVKSLQEQDDALTKARAKTKVEQRDLRLKMGQMVSVLQSDLEWTYVADRSGLTVARLKDYAFVRAQWPDGTFPADSNYTALEELARDEDRFAKITPGMSKRDARAAKGGKVDTPARWSAKTKADFASESAKDPEVAKAMVQDPAFRAALAEAEWQARQARRAAETPGRKQARVSTEKAELLRSVDNIRYAIGKAVSKAIDLGMAGDGDLLDVAAEASDAMSWLTEYAASGDTTFDAALAALLDEES